jgi:N utilization substance protein A
VVENVVDPRREISLEDARKNNEYAQLGDEIQVEDTPRDAGRIAAQTAKQVVLQRLREAERELVFEEFADRESELVTGVVQRIDPRQIVLDLGRTEGVLPAAEQVKSEHYRIGQRIKAYIVEVLRTGKGPQVIVSRTHRNLLRRLFELEVPEVNTGVIELKAVAREAGHRSKVAVAARQPGIDAIGSCVGLRGIRIQNIVNELNGEKIDVIEWHSDPASFIANALSPAQVVSVSVNSEDKAATVIVPDRQLSLAIGKEGQNARLAARLTGWRIDIKSASTAEAEAAAEVEQPVETEEPIAQATAADVTLVAPEELVTETEEPEEEYVAEKELPVEKVAVSKPVTVIRFAEDILPDRVLKDGKKAKKIRVKIKAKDEEKVKVAAKPQKARAPKIELEEAELEELEVPIEEEKLDQAEASSSMTPPDGLDIPVEVEKPIKKKKGKTKVKGEAPDKVITRDTVKPKKARRAPKVHRDEDEVE